MIDRLQPRASVSEDEKKKSPWTDGIVQGQYIDFKAEVDKQRTTISAATFAETVDYFAEWSRNLGNKIYGRTSKAERVEIADLFENTATTIKGWMERFGSDSSSQRIHAIIFRMRELSEHVRNVE